MSRYFLCSQNKDSMVLVFFQFLAVGFFCRNARSEGGAGIPFPPSPFPSRAARAVWDFAKRRRRFAQNGFALHSVLSPAKKLKSFELWRWRESLLLMVEAGECPRHSRSIPSLIFKQTKIVDIKPTIFVCGDGGNRTLVWKI